MLDALSAEETDALLDGLGGAVLETDQRARIVETAEGNPLFLEQLLALALEGGLAERPLPETIQALLAARLDRLGPGERAVLERGAVIGKEFAAGRCRRTARADAAPTADAHLRTLSDRGFVRPRERGGCSGFDTCSCRRPSTARLRSGCGRSSTSASPTGSTQTSPDLAELDEFVGYHLEQAYSLRTELGSQIGGRSALLKTAAGGLARLGFGPSSVATCLRR